MVVLGPTSARTPGKETDKSLRVDHLTDFGVPFAGHGECVAVADGVIDAWLTGCPVREPNGAASRSGPAPRS